MIGVQGAKDSRIRVKCLKITKYISYASNCELETQMMLSGDLDYIDSALFRDIMDDIYEVERMLKALITSLENKHLNPCRRSR